MQNRLRDSYVNLARAVFKQWDIDGRPDDFSMQDVFTGVDMQSFWKHVLFDYLDDDQKTVKATKPKASDPTAYREGDKV